MSIFLLILKIIGITLLSVLGIILLLLLLILFCPVKYRIKADYHDNNFRANIKASWLHIVQVLFVYDEEADFKIKLFFWNLIGSDKKEKEKKNVKNNVKNNKSNTETSISHSESSSSASSESETGIKSQSASESFSASENDIIASTESTVSESEEIKSESAQNSNCQTSESESISNNASETSDISFEDTKSDNEKGTKHKIYDKIKKVIEVIKSDDFKTTYPIIKKKVIKLLKAVLPRKWNVDATIGFEDPSKTGQILVYTSMIYPFFKKHIRIMGDFENKVIDAHANGRGHITVFKLLYVFLSIYFDKKIKKLLTKFKEAYNG